MRQTFIRLLLIALAVIATAKVAFPQSDTSEGDYPGAVYLGTNYEHVDAWTGRVYLDIPLLTDHSQRGDMNFSYSVVWSGMGAWEDTCYKTYKETCYFWPSVAGGYYPEPNKYWGPTPIMDGSLTGAGLTTYGQITAVAVADGGVHPVGYNVGANKLTETVDGSGIQIASNQPANPEQLVDRNGRKFMAGSSTSAGGTTWGTFAISDRFGNQMTTSPSIPGFTQDQFYPFNPTIETNPDPWTMTDTVGRTWSYGPASSTSGCPSGVGADHAYIWTTPGQNGGTRVFEFCFSPITISFSAEDQYGNNDSYSDSADLLSAIVLPDGTSWQLQYTDSYGDLTKLILPTGGSITYQYTTTNSGIYQGFQTFIRRLSSRTVSDGTNSSTWSYNWSYGQNPPYQPFYTVTDPLGNATVYTIVSGNSVIQYYAGSASTGTLLKTVTTTSLYVGGTALPQSITTAWANGQSATVTVTYDPEFQYNPATGGVYDNGAYGVVTSKTETDYGGATLRQTNTEYEWQVNSSFLNANWLAMPYQVGVTGPGGTASVSCFFGTAQSCTTFGYDGVGDETSVTQSLNTGSSPVTQRAYNSYGMLTSMIDPNNNTTNYKYDSTGVCVNEVDYPTPSSGVAQIEHFVCDPNTQQITQHTDRNGNITTFTFDDMLRPLTVSFPDTGETTYSYPNPNEVNFSQKITNSTSKTGSSLFDGLGRQIQEIVSNGESLPYDQTDTCYDALGRIGFTSYPYQGSGLSASPCPSAHPGDTTAYDALSRITSVTHSDTTSVITFYTGRATSVQDEGNGVQRVQRVSQVDGLGRLASVCEITNTTLVGISGSTTPAACGQDIADEGFLTSYTYDALDNLTSITQGTLNARSFVYDSLSRLTSSTNPESGTTSYTYDADGNVSTKIDARGITTCFGNWSGGACNTSPNVGYDAINRLLEKSYSDGTPTAYYYYDKTSWWSFNLTNTIGRLAYQGTYSGTAFLNSSAFSYDPMGRVIANPQCTPPPGCPAGPASLAYTYDLLGDMTSSPNGAGGITITYGYNTGGRLTSVTSSLSDAQHPALLWGNPVHYNAAGGVTSATFGNGIIETRSYDTRQRLTGITDGSVYTVTIPSYASNSDVLAANDKVNGNWTYAYDPFNRLIGSNKNSGAMTFTYAYDRFGNRWNQTATAGGGPSPSYGFGANNRIVAGYGVTYDAAGNVTNDGTTAYTFDAENRITSAVNAKSGTSSYVYDAEGHRVQRTTTSGTVYDLYDLGGHEISEIGSGGGWNRGEIYAGDRHIATYAESTTYFIHADWLGTERVRSVVGGTPSETCTSLPFGDWLTCVGLDISPMHFTGKEHDFETGLENFGARYDSSAMGRFMSSDPYNAGADLAVPQSWNMYAYVLNNPLTFLDPTGMECVWDDGSYDSNDDPDTGSANKCSALGGQWVDHSYFQQNGLPDWSSDANPYIANYATNYTVTVRAKPITLKSTICSVNSVVPQGQALSVGGTFGTMSSITGSMNLVTDYNTGQTNLFLTGGTAKGLNAVASGSVSGGVIYSATTFSMSDYSGHFSTDAVSIPAGFGGFFSGANGTAIGALSMGGSLFPIPGAEVEQTNTTRPLLSQTQAYMLTAALGGSALSSSVFNMWCSTP